MISLEHRFSLSGFEFDSPQELVAIDNDAVIACSSLLPWSNLSRLLSDQDVKLVKTAPEHQYNANTGLPFVQACLVCLKKCTDEDITQFILVNLEEFLQKNNDAGSLFLSLQSSEFDVYSLLLRIVARSDYHPFTVEKACTLLALLISLKPPGFSSDRKVVSMFGSWLSAKTADTNDRSHSAALACLKTFLSQPAAQEQFAVEGGLSSLVRTLQFESNRNTQVVYQAGFCIWLLSFNIRIHSVFLRDLVVPVLVDTIRTVSRDKVARIIIASIRNLIGHLCFNEMLVQLNFISTIDSLEQRATAFDPEMAADIAFIRSELQKAVKQYSSFEVFLNELQMGQLKWGPIHAEAFWKENASKCEVDGFAPVKRLIELLESKHNQTVAICCFDLGEFARIYPAGKQILRKLGGQEKLMLKMSHPDQEVQQQALLCVQKVMVNNWAVLQRGKN